MGIWFGRIILLLCLVHNQTWAWESVGDLTKAVEDGNLEGVKLQILGHQVMEFTYPFILSASLIDLIDQFSQL